MERGRLMDEYVSVPSLRNVAPGDAIALRANPTVLSRLTGADPVGSGRSRERPSRRTSCLLRRTCSPTSRRRSASKGAELRLRARRGSSPARSSSSTNEGRPPPRLSARARDVGAAARRARGARRAGSEPLRARRQLDRRVGRADLGRVRRRLRCSRLVDGRLRGARTRAARRRAVPRSLPGRCPRRRRRCRPEGGPQRRDRDAARAGHRRLGAERARAAYRPSGPSRS